jgi:glutaminase
LTDQASSPVSAAELQQIADSIVREARALALTGSVTSRVPALAEVDPDQLGLAILTRHGDVVTAGDANTPFSIQSISKVFSLELALEAYGADLWKRVGREPSGDPYNSIIDLERHKGIPRNPFINAGALVVVDALLDLLKPDDEIRAIIDFVSALLGGEEFGISEEVARSDEEAGHMNRALMSVAKHFDNLNNPIHRVMDAYVHQCAIELSCRQLAWVGRFLMLEGPDEAACRTGDAGRRARRIQSLMMTCGQYDGSGDFAYRVGLPAKSGVGGGILAIVPNTASIAVWSPGLDDSGNSLLGTLALEMLTDRVEWSVFGRIRTL